MHVLARVCGQGLCLWPRVKGQKKGCVVHRVFRGQRSLKPSRDPICGLGDLCVQLEKRLPFRGPSLLCDTLFASCPQDAQNGQARSSAFGSFQSVMKKLCKEPASFFSGSNSFINLPRVNELLGGDKERFNIPEDSSKATVMGVCIVAMSPRWC